MSCTDHTRGGVRAASRFLPWALLLLLLASGAALAAPPPAGEAQVGVYADLTRPDQPDTVSIRIVGNKNPELVGAVAVAVAMKLNAVVSEMQRSEVDPNFVADGGVGVNFRVPVMSRADDGLLPLAPFVEAVAPHVNTLKIAYVITGPFTYRGYEHYENPDVSFVVDKPQIVAASGAAGPTIATYGVHATIKNQMLTAALPTYPPPPAPARRNPWPLILLLAGVVLVCGGLGAAGMLLLPRLKAWAADGDQAKGTSDDRER